MESIEIIRRLASIFGCSERTAQSLYKKLIRVVSKEIMEVEEIPANINRIIKYKDESGKEYYALIGSGFFVQKIFKDSLDGEIVYKAIK